MHELDSSLMDSTHKREIDMLNKKIALIEYQNAVNLAYLEEYVK